jgi:DNA-binding LacI/PurR family transcriptional regulator
MPATLQEVANLAGVSIGTASQALNNRPNVRAETRTKVMDAARSIGYVFRDLNGSCDAQMGMVGMLVKHDYGLEVAPNPFYSHIQMGVENECRKRNLHLMYSSIEVDPSNRPVDWPTMIRDSALEGLLLIGTFIENTIDLIQKQIGNIPVILIDSYAPHINLDSIVTDNVNGAAAMVEYLIRQGHCKIGLIGWNVLSPPSIQERCQGYERALRSSGIFETFIEAGVCSREDSYAAAKRLLSSSTDITSIFCCNDESAIGVIQAARDMGLKLPEDLSVAGFDNIDTARDITPALTTVHVQKAFMGMLGVRYLLDRYSNPDQPKITTLVSTQLVIRGSVVPPKTVLATPGGENRETELPTIS